jgi:hypothetical protein
MNRPKRQGTAHSAENFNKNQPARARFRLYLVLVLLAGLLFIAHTYLLYIHRSETEAINLAQAFEAFIGLDILDELEAAPRTLTNLPIPASEGGTDYLCQSATGKCVLPISIVYRDGRVYFLADSEPPESPAYSPPGQAYDGYSEQDFNRLRQGEVIVTPLVRDQMGNLGHGYRPGHQSAQWPDAGRFWHRLSGWQWYWQNLCSIPGMRAALVIGFYWPSSPTTAKTVSNELLRQERDKLAVMTRKMGESENCSAGFLKKRRSHRNCQRLSFYLGDESAVLSRLLGRSFTDWLPSFGRNDPSRSICRKTWHCLRSLKPGKTMVMRWTKDSSKPDGKAVWVKMIIAPLTFDEQGLVREHLCLLEDITERYRMIRELQESERSLLYTNAHDFLTGLYNRQLF